MSRTSALWSSTAMSTTLSVTRGSRAAGTSVHHSAAIAPHTIAGPPARILTTALAVRDASPQVFAQLQQGSACQHHPAVCAAARLGTVCCQAAAARLLKVVAQQRVTGCLRCYPLQVSCYCVMLHLLRAEGLPLGGVEGHPGCPHRCRDLHRPWRQGLSPAGLSAASSRLASRACRSSCWPAGGAGRSRSAPCALASSHTAGAHQPRPALQAQGIAAFAHV